MNRTRLTMPGLALLGILLALFILAPAGAATGDTAADRIIGQPDFVHGLGSGCNQGASSPSAATLCFPFGVAVDATGHLYIADRSNNRVLGYDSPLTTDAVADRVIGQGGAYIAGQCNQGGAVTTGTLCFHAGSKAPSPVAVDSAGNLYVADVINSRVLQYDDPVGTDTIADRVFGHDDFTANMCNDGKGFGDPPTASSLCIPVGVALDEASNLYVADSGNNRVLEYDSPLTTDAVADRVIGQADFTTSGCNVLGSGSPPTASTLCLPDAVAVDGAGNLYVADTDNNRVLEYASPLTTDSVADQVFGQADFATTTCNTAGPGSPPTASSLCRPFGVALDGANNLYVADNSNNRVVEYDDPLATDAVADLVFGQGGSFSSNACNLAGTSASSLCEPQTAAIDGAGNLYVADAGNHRVLEYDIPLTTDVIADRVFGQASFTLGGRGCNQGDGPTASTLCWPSGGAADATGNIYIADLLNNRVLGYEDPEHADAGADRVFGQGGDFTTGECNKDGISASSLCFVSGKTGPVAVDGAGNVYIADTQNNRVLEYDNPMATDTVADRVFGQDGFTNSSCNKGAGVSSPTASSLCFPDGVAVDSGGNLYIADRGNNRVVAFQAPLTTDAVSDRVFGQPDFASNVCNTAGPGSPPTASTLCDPNAVAVDRAGNLYVADGNSRVLEYSAPSTSDSVADLVLGQGGSFTTSTCNLGSISASSLCAVSGVAVDSAGNLYVGDRFNNRALRYDDPLNTGTVADQVFGQENDFTTGLCNKGGIGARSLCFLDGVWVDGLGNLYVADSGNNRVLEYDVALSSTPTPQPGTISGDVDCNGTVTAVDALQVLRFVAGLPPNLPPGCPPVGAAAATRNFADVTCDGNVDSVDALRILRYVAGLLTLPTEPGCLPIGTAPTPTPTATPSLPDVAPALEYDPDGHFINVRISIPTPLPTATPGLPPATPAQPPMTPTPVPTPNPTPATATPTPKPETTGEPSTPPPGG